VQERKGFQILAGQGGDNQSSCSDSIADTMTK
jgi:hypothetical protein